MDRASEDGTREHSRRHGVEQRPWSYRTLGPTGLTASAIGFGGYRVDDDREEHSRALDRALRGGVNLIDTSTNYTDGGSERAIGGVLAALAADGTLSRDAVIVVSKVGYVQGSNMGVLRAREREGRPFDDVVRYADGCWHCIHPDFVSDQIGRSLSRLGLAHVDVELLHNPEYMLMDAEHRAEQPLARRREELDRRLKLAFARLEEEADAGRIGWYGVSSNSFVVSAEAAEATSLARMIELASEVARERGRARSRFAVAQLPANLLETGAMTAGAGRSGEQALDVARRAGLAVLVNRPLNAFVHGQLVRLADFPDPAAAPLLRDAAQAVIDLEQEFERTIAPALEGEGASGRLLRWGQEMLDNAHRFADVLHWRQVESDYVRPRVEHVMRHVGLHLVGKVRNDWAAWRERYEPALEELLRAVEARAIPPARDRSTLLRRKLRRTLPPAWQDRPLSQAAIGALLGTPGVTSVLVGMRRGGIL